jgi:predicted thioesterase
MEITLQPGLTGQVQEIVEERHTAPHLGGDVVPVMATPAMISLMESAAVEAIEHLLPEGYQSVGIRIDVRHLAPTPVGMQVTARAELTKVEGRVLTFRVTAEDEEEQVGEGTHQRAIIDVTGFQERIKAKMKREA